MGDYTNFVKGFPADEDISYFEDAHTTQPQEQVAAVPLPGVVMDNPTSPEEVEKCIDYLKARRVITVQLSGEEPALSQRILDMLAGAVYALNGSIATVNKEQNIYMLTPEGVSISIPIKKQRD